MDKTQFDRFLEDHAFQFFASAIPTPCLPLGLMPTAEIMHWWECKVSLPDGDTVRHEWVRHFNTPAHGPAVPTLRETMLLLTADAMSFWAHDDLCSFHRVVMPQAHALIAEVHYIYAGRRAALLARLMGSHLQAYLQAWTGVAEVYYAHV